MDDLGLDDPRDQVKRGAVLASVTAVAAAIAVSLGGLGNMMSNVVATAVAVVAFQVSLADLLVGGLRMLPRRSVRSPTVGLPVARVVDTR